MTKEEKAGKNTEDDKGYVKWLFELSNKDIAIAGGKGASLAEMFNSKFPVPPAFIITAQAFQKFISNVKVEIDDVLNKTDVNNTQDLNEASKKIREIIEKEEFEKDMEEEILESYESLGTPDGMDKAVGEALDILKRGKEPIFVAVRSSATTEDLKEASFAGQQETFLNIKGKTELLKKIKKCFSSLYTPRAIYYRDKRGFRHVNALLSVVVQKMINSDKSGVMFSKNPIRNDQNILIEAVFGLGEGIVSGKIHPDNYLVNKDLEILKEQIADKKKALVRNSSGETEEIKLTEQKSNQQVLTTGEVKELAEYAQKLEQHYEKPQDIEFAIESGKIYIVQSRPITTSAKELGKELDGKVLLSGLSASSGVASGKVKIIHTMDDLNKVKKGDILVTEMTNPDMVVTMQRSDAIVTDEGGMTSHAAIISREMGIPCVVGTKQATQILKDDQIVTVDGGHGKIYEGEVGKETKTEVLPIENTKTRIKVLVDLPDFAERAAKTHSKYVGLIRLEGIIASSGKHPLMFLAEDRVDAYSKMLEKGIKEIAEHFEGVWIRSSDIRSDEYRNLQGAPKEQEVNPMLGFHGIRFSLKNPKLLEAEFQAVKNVAEKFPDKKIGIMFPQVISVDDVRQTKKIFEKFKRENMQFGIMVETPAACMIIDELVKEGLDFVSFGTNDLTQFTLALDRGNENIQDLYDETHPAVLRLMKRVIEVCKDKGVETSICGQAGSKKDMVKFLVKAGINSISVNADVAREISVYVKGMEESMPETVSSENPEPEGELIQDKVETMGKEELDDLEESSMEEKIEEFEKKSPEEQERMLKKELEGLGKDIDEEDEEKKSENVEKKVDSEEEIQEKVDEEAEKEEEEKEEIEEKLREEQERKEKEEIEEKLREEKEKEKRLKEQEKKEEQERKQFENAIPEYSPEEKKKKELEEKTEKVEEFPDTDIGIDVFQPQEPIPEIKREVDKEPSGHHIKEEKQVGKIDDTREIEKNIKEIKEEVEEEKRKDEQEEEEIDENIKTELKPIEELKDQEKTDKLEEKEPEKDEEVKEVIDELRGKKDEEDIDIPNEEEKDEDEDDKDEKLDIF